MHTRAVPLVLLDVRRWHDEVTNLPGAAARVQSARLVPLVRRCPARVSPVVCACRRGNFRVFWNGTCSHVLRDGELRQSLRKRKTASPDRAREVELDSCASNWGVWDCRRSCWARQRQMFLVQLFDLFGRANETVVAISN